MKNKLYLWLHSLKDRPDSILFLGYALGVFLIFAFHSKYQPVWYFKGDPADYVYLAEQFFKLSHHLTQSDQNFPKQWRDFLTTVPFRQVGVGSYYLLMFKLFGPSKACLLGSLIIKAMLGLSYATLERAVRKRSGWMIGLFSIIILLGTTERGTSGDILFSECFARIIFLLGLSLALKQNTACRSVSSTALILAWQAQFLILAHLKVQWMLLAFFVTGYQLFSLYKLQEFKKMGILFALSSVVPVSIVAVNQIGWNFPKFAGGIFLHSMYAPPDHGERFLNAACQVPEIQTHLFRFCIEKKYSFESWGEFFQYEFRYTPLQITVVLDRYAASIIDFSPARLWNTFIKGVKLLTNFPYPDPKSPLRECANVLDFVSICLCVVGLFRRTTRFAAAYSLGFWGVVIAGLHVAMWDDRYMTPMAGIPLIMSIVILLESWGMVRLNFVRWMNVGMRFLASPPIRGGPKGDVSLCD